MKAARVVALSAAGLLFGAAAGAAQSALETALSHLEYREIGPALMGGRIADIAVVEAKPQIFYLGTATAGLWKTENHGTSWTPLFDDQPTSSIGDVTLHQANPNLVWVGTGEPQNRQSSPWGNGVYKSTDGGKTWMHKGLEGTKHIARILIHPRNPDVVHVAAVGDLWGSNEDRGVFRTRDGGDSWEKVLYIDQHTGAIDLAMDPADPNTIFAAMYQRQRTGWGFNGGGPGSGLYRTVDGGENWTELTEGLPEGEKGRIGIDIYRHDGNLVYALVEADPREPGQGFRGGGGGPRQGGIFRSTDRGTTWEKMSDTNPRPMYYSQVRIDPGNPDRIYVLGTQLSISDDGGRTFRDDGSVQIHVDHHQLWIDPADSDHLILGSDGGVTATWDGTAHWRMFDNIALGQFYAIGYDMRTPYAVCGGLQDNDAWCGPSDTRSFHGIRNQDWYETAYGDGFFTIVDPTDSTIVYSESQGGNMNRYDLTTGEKIPMRPIVGPRAEGDTTKAYRYNWNSPLLLSPHDPATVYLGANYLLRSRDYGMSWEEVGGLDLTKQIDREELEIMGVPGSEPQMSLNDGISTYGNLTSVEESPLVRGLIYAGTDDGNLQVSRDDGATWENVADRLPGLPERTYVSRVEPSAHVEGRVYATFDGHRNGDYAPYAYVSEDYGQSWRAIANGLPDGWSVNVIVEHQRAPNLLFIGNEVGVFVSVDRGESWVQVKNNLPTVPVDDILVHPRENDLIVGTHGRSVWILADVTPLEHLADGMLAAAGRVFGDHSIMWTERGDWPFFGATYSAPNPPRGARIRYYLRDAEEEAMSEDEDEGEHEDDDEDADEDEDDDGDDDMDDDDDGEDDDGEGEDDDGDDDDAFSLKIADASGAHVRTLETPRSQGINEVIWDWRHDAPYEPEGGGGPGGGGGGGGGFGGGAPQGPIVLPGTYAVSMEAGGETFSAEVEVVAEPRRPMSAADRMARQDALMSLHAMAGPIYEAGQAANALDEQLSAAEELIEGADEAPEGLEEELDAIEEELEEIRDKLGEARRNAGVANAIQGSSTVPTDDHLWQVDEVWNVMPEVLDRLNVLIETRLPALNAQLYADAVRPPAGEPIAMPERPGG
ncbi:VPS10 domain-containing protein [Candidatus Palauibacter sp.]|uniref:VPS10 domain-containing protein n=1 Tax=Candidatus Palauibacter sp. TaxID=3101350 RepID=UPI003B019F30